MNIDDATDDVGVAPLVGAWIETFFVLFSVLVESSHPSWVRGLKLLMWLCSNTQQQSHPSWVRGLKHLLASQPKAELPSRTPRGCVD